MVDTDAIDAVFSQWDRDDSPGCTVGVCLEGDLVFAKGYGMADLEHGVANMPETVFDIGSTSKQFTAATALLVAREGKLSLDDNIRLFIPALPDFGKEITVRHLVHHTSGIRDYLNLYVMAGRSTRNDYPEEEVVALLARQRKLDFPPGTRMSYSNSGYFLLGEIVRAVTDQSLRAAAHERIFEPLGMTRTFFHDDFMEVVPNRAVGYAPVADGKGHTIDVSLWDVVGDGALFTTVGDLAQWDRQFYACDLAGGDDFIAELCTPGRLANGKPLTYAFGLMIGEHQGLRTVEHGGAWAGYRTQFVRFPDQRLSVMVLANLGTIEPDGLAKQVAAIVLGDAVKPATSTSGRRASIGGFEEVPLAPGMYCDRAATLIAEVVRGDDGLSLVIMGRPFRLEPVAPGRYKLETVGVEVERRGDDALRIDLGTAKPVLRRLQEERPSESELGAYAGRYRSDELDAEYDVEAYEGGVRVRVGFGQQWDLVAAGGDLFGSGGGVLRFRRRNGAVNGFVLNTARAAGIVFRRVKGA